MRLIDADALYKAMQDAEELARKRVLDTKSTMPFQNNINPSYTRYVAQMDERTRAKEMIADAPTVDAVPVVRCKDCKNSEHWYKDRRRCFLWNEDGVSVFDDGFCNYGERGEQAERRE